MDKATKAAAPTQPIRPIFIALLDAFEILGVSRSFGWKLVKEDPEFPETVTLGRKRLVRFDGVERYAEIKAKKSAALQSERMSRVRARRAKHDGEFEAAAPKAAADKCGATTAQKKMPA